MWVALKPITVGATPLFDDDGEIVTDALGNPVTTPLVRQPGEHVPEADAWHDVAPYVNTGQIAFVADGPVENAGIRAELDQVQAELAGLRKEIDVLKRSAHSHTAKTAPKTTKE